MQIQTLFASMTKESLGRGYTLKGRDFEAINFNKTIRRFK